MTQEQWGLVEAHFDDLREASQAGRVAGLSAIEDEEVRREVESLLQHSGGGSAGDGGGGETVIAAVGAMAAHLDEGPLPERRIGPYRLLKRVGQGGQGAVFEAVRDDGTFHQRVAIKIVKWDMDSDAARERFRQERQILAGLQHPNIARLLDGGETEDGTPYLVMEFVEGQPMTVAASDWPLRRKLELFLKVCQALEHAHRNLVIHRDLKPANILVTAEGEPKLLDFGIAKLIDPAATKTQTGMAALTPEYASPEQVRGLPISTSSDVYSLGVVLYQLLTNRKPYKLDTTSPFEMDRVICVQPPTPPALGDELDHILLMALRKEPERRYLSVERFAEDVERYLNNEPVRARPDTLLYRTRKYVRRQRVGLAWAAFALIALVAGTAQAIRAGWRADAEAAAAKEINSFLENDLLSQASAYQQPDPKITVRTALDRAAKRIDGRFTGQSQVEASLRRTIGKTYTELGLYSEARRQVERAVELDVRAFGPNARETLATQTQLSKIDYFLARYAESEARLRDTLAKQQRQFGNEDADAVDTMGALGITDLGWGKLEDAERLLEKVAALRNTKPGAETPDMLMGLGNLASVYDGRGKYQQAADLNRRVAEADARVLGPDHPETFAVQNNLAHNYVQLGRLDEAEAIFIRLFDIKRRILGPEHPDTLTASSNVAFVNMYQGKFAEAVERNRALLDVRRRLEGPDDPETLTTLHNLASGYYAIGNYALAASTAAETFERRKRVLGAEHGLTVMSMVQLAADYSGLGRDADAESLLQQCIGIQRRTLGSTHLETLKSMSRLAGIYSKQGKPAQAQPLQTEVFNALRQAFGPENPNTLTSSVSLALTDHLLHQDSRGEELLRATLPVYRTQLPDNWQRYRCESVLGETLAAQRKYGEAEPLLLSGYQGMLERKSKIASDARINLDNAAKWIVSFYRDTGRPEKAAEWKVRTGR